MNNELPIFLSISHLFLWCCLGKSCIIIGWSFAKEEVSHWSRNIFFLGYDSECYLMNCMHFFSTLYRERPCTYLILHQSKRKVVECVFTEILFCWESFVMDVDFLHQLNFALPSNITICAGQYLIRLWSLTDYDFSSSSKVVSGSLKLNIDHLHQKASSHHDWSKQLSSFIIICVGISHDSCHRSQFPRIPYADYQ